MPKSGHPLEAIPGFDPALVNRLRDDFSVTTAEEFIGLWRNVPSLLANVLGGREQADRLADLVCASVSPEELSRIVEAEKSQYPFSTGHEPPPPDKGTL